MNREDKDRLLAASAPLPPLCEQYLDFGTLGSRESEDAVIEHFIEAYVNNPRTNPKEDVVASAREHVSSFDDVTINLMGTAFERELIEFKIFAKIRANDLRGLRARNYVLLQIAIRDLQARSGSFRQFDGLHVQENNDPNGALLLDLSTDEQYRGNVACLRYGVMVTNALPMHEERVLFYRRSGQDDLILDPKMAKLLWSRPDQADRIAGIVIQRRSQDPEMIVQVLDGSAASSLGSGVL